MTTLPPLIPAFLGFALIAALVHDADAALYADGITSTQTIDFGAPFAGRALSFNIIVPTGGYRSTSATFLNSRYALTAAHNVTDLLIYNPTYEVADGTNVITSRGNVMAVTTVLFHPSLDLAILRFAAPFYAAPNQTIGSAVTGDITYSAGFGSWGTPATGLISPRDPGLRGWDARVANIVFSGSAPFYQPTRFGSDDAGLRMNARAANGDSGGPVFNALGELIGINVFASTVIANFGNTTYVRLGEPSTKVWIEANTALPAAVPDLSLSLAGAAMRLNWDAAATGYRLQASGDLTGWTDLGSLITGPGTYDDVTADRRRFYRLFKP